MDYNERDVVEKWNEWFPEIVEDDVNDSDTGSDVWSVTKLSVIQEKLRILKEKLMKL